MTRVRRRILPRDEGDSTTMARWPRPTTFGETVRTFYLYFAAAYGTLWLVFLGLATVTVSRIETGLVGYVGFPVVAAVYAGVRLRHISRR